jgi:hypothetical protein
MIFTLLKTDLKKCKVCTITKFLAYAGYHLKFTYVLLLAPAATRYTVFTVEKMVTRVQKLRGCCGFMKANQLWQCKDSFKESLGQTHLQDCTLMLHTSSLYRDGSVAFFFDNLNPLDFLTGGDMLRISMNSKSAFKMLVNWTTCKCCTVFEKKLITILMCVESLLGLTMKSDK